MSDLDTYRIRREIRFRRPCALWELTDDERTILDLCDALDGEMEITGLLAAESVQTAGDLREQISILASTIVALVDYGEPWAYQAGEMGCFYCGVRWTKKKLHDDGCEWATAAAVRDQIRSGAFGEVGS